MEKVVVQSGEISEEGFLNDTLAAREFAKQLPCKCRCRKNEAEYYSRTAKRIFDPCEISYGFEKGDISLFEGWISLALRDAQFDEKDMKNMIIGHIDNVEEIKKLSEKIQMTIKIANREGLKMKYRSKEEFEKADKFGIGAPNTAYAKYFIGNSYLKPLTDKTKTTMFVANVTFEPGCRNNWHIHHAKSGGGQILICTAGEGWYQEEGKAAVSLTPGTVITIPAGVKHWHGAKADSWFSHIAFEAPGEDPSNEWLEPVTDEEYGKLK